MLRIVLWAAAACAVLLAALALSRGARLGSDAEPVREAPSADRADQPAAARAPAPEPEPAPLPAPEPEPDAQVQEDAAATGLTTVEPPPEAPAGEPPPEFEPR